MPKDITETLIELKRTITSAERELAQLEGRLEARKEEMKETFKVNSLKEAKQKLESIAAELSEEQEAFQKEVKKLDSLYHDEEGE